MLDRIARTLREKGEDALVAEDLFRCLQRLPEQGLVVGLQDRHEPSTNPFRNRGCHGVADGVISEAIDTIRLPLVEMLRTRPIDWETLHPLDLVGCEAAHPAIRIPDVVP